MPAWTCRFRQTFVMHTTKCKHLSAGDASPGWNVSVHELEIRKRSIAGVLPTSPARGRHHKLVFAEWEDATEDGGIASRFSLTKDARSMSCEMLGIRRHSGSSGGTSSRHYEVLSDFLVFVKGRLSRPGKIKARKGRVIDVAALQMIAFGRASSLMMHKRPENLHHLSDALQSTQTPPPAARAVSSSFFCESLHAQVVLPPFCERKEHTCALLLAVLDFPIDRNFIIRVALGLVTVQVANAYSTTEEARLPVLEANDVTRNAARAQSWPYYRRMDCYFAHFSLLGHGREHFLKLCLLLAPPDTAENDPAAFMIAERDFERCLSRDLSINWDRSEGWPEIAERYILPVPARFEGSLYAGQVTVLDFADPYSRIRREFTDEHEVN
ncbi:hypothetical protein SCHPADRAFT_951648 [Schizopora paradoxa]|uniref:Uncharacterized protein n=1 Tax=Schizopora paradoxa TaxID=27342 RepID=A0A0H2SDA1_9AGAM|nr:hypothetical protein SCHPADRAFT_951648 [Schizopora paradoxa]